MRRLSGKSTSVWNVRGDLRNPSCRCCSSLLLLCDDGAVMMMTLMGVFVYTKSPQFCSSHELVETLGWINVFFRDLDFGMSWRREMRYWVKDIRRCVRHSRKKMTHRLKGVKSKTLSSPPVPRDSISLYPWLAADRPNLRCFLAVIYFCTIFLVCWPFLHNFFPLFWFDSLRIFYIFYAQQYFTRHSDAPLITLITV